MTNYDLVIDKISKLIVPFGTFILATSPTDFPKRPLPIGEFTDILPSLKFASLSATKVYSNVAWLAWFLIFTLDKTRTFEESSWDSSMSLAFESVSSNFEILSITRS